MKENSRYSGVVLPVASLPSPYGIGTFGKGAYDFVDFLRKAGQRYWQILPLSPTSYGDSPYQSPSARAGNPYFIDLELLEKEGLLLPEEYIYLDFNNHPDRVDYGAVYENRYIPLRKAFERAYADMSEEIEAFRRQNESWLEDYALFMAVKTHFGMVALREWPDKAILRREKNALITYRNLLSKEIQFHIFLQYLFIKQWTALKEYANENGIYIIGDVPIYVAEDSVEVWAESELFLLEEPAVPAVVAGVPPDLYSETGQLWGNPIYNWPLLERGGFRWWIERLRHNAQFYDIIRIDHFRGFYNYWVVKAGEETAMNGKWVKGPGMKFVRAIKEALPEVGFIAEDLGDLDDEVREFFVETGMPGMTVAIYGFDPCGNNEYMLHNTVNNKIAYTSTHDSPTFVGWLYGIATPEERRFAFDYLRLNQNEGYGWGAVNAVWGTPACLAMAPLQDILGLGEDARTNIPSTLGGMNWRWRVREEALNEHVAEMLKNVTLTYRRTSLEKPAVSETEAPEITDEL